MDRIADRRSGIFLEIVTCLARIAAYEVLDDSARPYYVVAIHYIWKGDQDNFLPFLEAAIPHKNFP